MVCNIFCLHVLKTDKFLFSFKLSDQTFLEFRCDRYCFDYRFLRDKRELPVLWHQAFLTFVQRYKEDISSEQKEALMELLRVQTHELISPEIRRELVHSKCRDSEGEIPQGSGLMEDD